MSLSRLLAAVTVGAALSLTAATPALATEVRVGAADPAGRAVPQRMLGLSIEASTIRRLGTRPAAAKRGRIVSTRRVRAGRVAVRVRCAGSGACSGVLRVRVGRTARSRRYTVRAGRTVTFTVRGLPRRGAARATL